MWDFKFKRRPPCFVEKLAHCSWCVQLHLTATRLLSTKEVMTAATGVFISWLFTHQIGFFLLSTFGWNNLRLLVHFPSFISYPQPLQREIQKQKGRGKKYQMFYFCTSCFFLLLALCYRLSILVHFLCTPITVSVIWPVECLQDWASLLLLDKDSVTALEWNESVSDLGDRLSRVLY